MPATSHTASRELLSILKPFWSALSVSIVLGIGGLSITALLISINRLLNTEGGMTTGMMLAFSAICGLALTSSILSNIGTNYVGQKIIARLRKTLGVAVQTWWPTTDRSVLSGFVMTLLFMNGPLENVLSLLPLISRNRSALRRIAELNAQFSNPEPYLLLENASPGSFAELHSIELREVSYSYPGVPGSTAFRFGPVNLQIKRGEILFIVGENGCGKTTLIKLLLGLYIPHDGALLLNGETVTAQARDDYRQLFTTVFADYHLFDDVVHSEAQLPEAANRYLERLEIAHKVSIQDGAFTTTDLSTGQRKRLALINAWLEERSVLVFDEWAADQDPTFRRIFYTELLPDLKRMDKTIIVISHDDRYFAHADQLVRMEAGRVMIYLQQA